MGKVGPEVWLARRGEFVVRVKDRRSSWTFRVPRSALEALDGIKDQSPQALFDLHRPKIYAVVQHLMSTGNAQIQQTITAEEINRFSPSLDGQQVPSFHTA